MRQNVEFASYQKIKNFFNSQTDKEFTATAVRNALNIDYQSVNLILEILKKEKYINQKLNKYYKRRDKHGRTN